ncbi:hypothetical protein V6N13_124290 [Hibiscus sabdariffa]
MLTSSADVMLTSAVNRLGYKPVHEPGRPNQTGSRLVQGRFLADRTGSREAHYTVARIARWRHVVITHGRKSPKTTNISLKRGKNQPKPQQYQKQSQKTHLAYQIGTNTIKFGEILTRVKTGLVGRSVGSVERKNDVAATLLLSFSFIEN